MSHPVSYVEINSPDPAASHKFFASVFGWQLQPFATPDYLVAPHGDVPGVDTGLMKSMDGQPRTIPVIRIGDLTAATALVIQHGGQVVMEPFAIAGVGRGCYVLDPTGVLLGLHAYDADADAEAEAEAQAEAEAE
ncbi:MAG: hypothetical protein JWL58_6430 [Streptosporangiaceae bacterium]|jgi:predicted enzyme related to lactoylglutathione lyase|nr:hypothetical protein [Streptosporangiaceae bacterium]